VDERGEVVLRRQVKRRQLLPLVAKPPPCLIGLEACAGAHHWAREFGQFGHTMKLMSAHFVAPYRKSHKNDGNDAEAICEAVRRVAGPTLLQSRSPTVIRECSGRY